MNWQSKSACWIIALLLIWNPLSLHAQPLMGINDTKTITTDNFPNLWAGYEIPDTETLTISLRGADGGHVDFRGSCDVIVKGGEGAQVEATYKVGPGGLRPGGTILGFLGTHGISADPLCSNALGVAGGGGGATAVLYLPPNTDLNGRNWRILAVAGAGGGASRPNAGNRNEGQGGRGGMNGGDSGGHQGGSPGTCAEGPGFSPPLIIPGIGSSIFCQDALDAPESDAENGLNLADRGFSEGYNNFTIQLVPFTGVNIINTAGRSADFPNGGIGFFGGGAAGNGGGGGGGIYGGAAEFFKGGGGGGSFVDKGFTLINSSLTGGRNGGGNIQHGTVTFTTCGNPSKAICKPNEVEIELDAMGKGTLLLSDVNNGSFVSTCNEGGSIGFKIGSDTYEDVYPIDCNTPSNFTATVEVYDANGKVLDACNTQVKVVNKFALQADCEDSITIDLAEGENGIVVLDPKQLDKGSTDNCSDMLSFSASQTTFDCSHIGNHLVTLTVTDDQGNEAECQTNITVFKIIQRPVVYCQYNVEVEIDASGNGSLNVAALDNGSIIDPCSFYELAAIDWVEGLLGKAFSRDYEWWRTRNAIYSGVIDGAGVPVYSIDQCASLITIVDNTPPSPECQSSFTVFLNQNEPVVLDPTLLDNGSKDNTEIVKYSASQTVFDCADIGSNPVTLTVEDIGGNTAECTTNVTVIDDTPPLAACLESIIINLEEEEDQIAVLDPKLLDNGSTDNCSAILSFSASQTTFNDSHLGNNLVTLTVKDDQGNEAECQTAISVIQRPIINCQANVEVEIDASSNGSLNVATLDNGSIIDPSSFYELAVFDLFEGLLGKAFYKDYDWWRIRSVINLGVIDGSSVPVNNIDQCTSSITIVDNIPPSPECRSSLSVFLNQNEPVVLKPSQLDNGSKDNTEIVKYSASQTVFDCAHIGSNPVTLTVEDIGGNTAECTTSVMVIDDTPPQADCKESLTIDLGKDEFITLNPKDLDNNSTDNCSSLSYSANLIEFDCFSLFSNPTMVTLTVKDASGNTDECQTAITVVKEIEPAIVDCHPNVEVEITEQGYGVISISSLDNNSVIPLCSFYQLGLFDDESVFLGQANPFEYEWLKERGSLNLGMMDFGSNLLPGLDQCTSSITIIDNIPPTAECKESVRVFPGPNGQAVLDPMQIDNGSTDNTEIVKYSASQTIFNCAQTDPTPVTLTIEDIGGNTAECSTNVIVNNTLPKLSCKSGRYNPNFSINLSLDGDGTASLDIDDIASDYIAPCGIASFDWSQSVFECEDIGLHQVSLTIVDNNGYRSNTCSAKVTIVDDTPPQLDCQQSLMISLDKGGTTSIKASQLDNGSIDNCSIAVMSANQTTFDCSNQGDNPVTLTVSDVNGNSSSCTVMVTVSLSDDGQRLSPVLEGITFNQQTAQYQACFGYANDNPCPITVPIGAQNKFTASTDMGQSSEFLPGRQVSVFCIDLAPGETVVWTLKGPDGKTRTATATAPSDDIDGDGMLNENDNCPDISNAAQNDRDNDGVGDKCDNCPNKSNSGQKDSDGDGIGDACDPCKNLDNNIDSDGDGISDCLDNCIDTPNSAQNDKDNDGVGDICDNCPDKSNSGQKDTDGDGIGDACDPCKNLDNNIDTDGDGISDCLDNCINTPNPAQEDRDKDGVGDKCDNCPDKSNSGQKDTDGDGIGDACDPCKNLSNDIDTDGDGVSDCEDNCINTPNPAQEDRDKDGVGDKCDNCPDKSNSGQKDTDGDGIGYACDPCKNLSNDIDTDGDGISDCEDNCIDTPNTAQNDRDNDGVGDICDNCPDKSNSGQKDSDGDGIGDACDPCKNLDNNIDTDGDGISDCLDNCIDTPNPAQEDRDNDGVGDQCDNCPDKSNSGQKDSDGDGIGDACKVSNIDPISLTSTGRFTQEEIAGPSLKVFPNPFTEQTTIAFHLPQVETVHLQIMNLQGQVVFQLLDGTMDAGTHQVDWNGQDDQGNFLPSGMYLMHLQVGQEVLHQKVILTRP